MPWHIWGATLNIIHGEDDFGIWISRDAHWGAAAVADGVSAASGGGLSFLATQGFIYACRAALGANIQSSFPGMMRILRDCFSIVSDLARRSRKADIDVIEAIKKQYYMRCCEGSKPCTEPLSLEYIVDEGLTANPSHIHVERETAPSTTLLAALLGPQKIALVLSGDGYLLGASPLSRDETWLLWGAIPQLFEGSRLTRFIELGRGALGRPLFVEIEAIPGTVYALSTDGVDAAILAEELSRLLQEHRSLTELGENPAAALLSAINERVNGVEDDATLVLTLYTEE